MPDKIDPTLLLRIGNWSIRPVDITSIRWEFESSIVDGRLDTSGRLGDCASFLLNDSDPTYAQDFETLKFISNPSNWIPKSEWLLWREPSKNELKFKVK